MFWYFVFADGKHVATWGTQREARDSRDRSERELPQYRWTVKRGGKKQTTIGGGYFVVSNSTGN